MLSNCAKDAVSKYWQTGLLSFLICRQATEASASQSLNRKDVKTEAKGTSQITDIHIENFDIAFGNK